MKLQNFLNQDMDALYRENKGSILTEYKDEGYLIVGEEYIL